MTPLQPQDAFGRSHVVALLLVGIDALARDVNAMTDTAETRAFVEPVEFDFALVGLCKLADAVRDFGRPDHEHLTGTAAPETVPAPSHTERMLR